MKSTQAGLTLLELVLAVALLGVVVTGSGWFIRESAQRAKGSGDLLRSEVAAEALLNAIERDVTLGDFLLPVPTTGAAKVKVDAGVLSVTTRSAVQSVGAVGREYSFRPTTGEVLASERTADTDAPRGAAPAKRVVLGGLRSFTAKFDPKSRTLAVALVAAEGTRSFGRRWVLP